MEPRSAPPLLLPGFEDVLEVDPWDCAWLRWGMVSGLVTGR